MDLGTNHWRAMRIDEIKIAAVRQTVKYAKIFANVPDAEQIRISGPEAAKSELPSCLEAAVPADRIDIFQGMPLIQLVDKKFPNQV